MNIVVGSHGVGKTTLLEQVRRVEKGIFVTDAFSRPLSRVVKKHKLSEDCNQDLNNELMMWATDFYLNQNVLSTRSIIDSIAYTRLYLPEKDTSLLEEKLREISSKIEHIFYIPIEFEIENDGVRPQDKELQKKDDLLLLSIIEEFGLSDRIRTISGSRDQRLFTILQYL